MKIKFNAFNAILLFGTSYYITYEMVSAGVPDAIVIPFNIIYAITFPWKIVTVVTPEEGEPKDVNDETDKSDNQ